MSQKEDTVRVLRVVEYMGSRSSVEHAVSIAIHGEKKVPRLNLTIRAATIGTYPEILAPAKRPQEKVESESAGLFFTERLQR